MNYQALYEALGAEENWYEQEYALFLYCIDHNISAQEFQEEQQQVIENFQEDYIGAYHTSREVVEHFLDMMGKTRFSYEWPFDCIDYELAWQQLEISGDAYRRLFIEEEAKILRWAGWEKNQTYYFWKRYDDCRQRKCCCQCSKPRRCRTCFCET